MANCPEIEVNTLEARGKCLGFTFTYEVYSHKDSIFVVLVFVPYGLVMVGVKPSPIAVIIAENSKVHIRTVTLRIAPPLAVRRR